jgi:hypothetical protein
VRRPRRVSHCDACGCRIVGLHIRLYGRADAPDPMSTLRLHVACAGGSDAKILAAVERAETMKDER